MILPKPFLLGVLGTFLLAGGVAWFFSRGEVKESYENQDIEVSVTEEESSSGREMEVPSREPTPSNDPPKEPAGVNLVPDSSVPASSPKVEESPKVTIVPRLITYGYRNPGGTRSIDTIVLHSSYNAIGGDVYDVTKILKQYEDYGVGAHYLIGRDGTIYRLVEENNIAYHAGMSTMPDGRKNVNDFSIGIEIVGTLDSGYTGKQYEIVNSLIADIKSRHSIKSIVGHGDIAPDRKTDPWKFDWKTLK